MPFVGKDIITSLKKLKRELAAHGDPKRAEGASAYLKHVLKHHGITTPELRALLHAFYAEHDDMTREDLLKAAAFMWDSEYWEEKIIAVAMLNRYEKLLTPADLDFLGDLCAQSGTWALLDTLATVGLPALVMRHPALYTKVRKWSKSDEMWKRRASILCHLTPMVGRDRKSRLPKGITADERNVRADLFYSTAAELAHEKDFFIRKAIGWVLREVSKLRPEEVRDFLMAHPGEFSGLTMGEACKYLPEEMQRELGMKVKPKKSVAKAR
jgi:3-methyladenine DNA glycosylase AlkD